MKKHLLLLLVFIIMLLGMVSCGKQGAEKKVEKKESAEQGVKTYVEKPEEEFGDIPDQNPWSDDDFICQYTSQPEDRFDDVIIRTREEVLSEIKHYSPSNDKNERIGDHPIHYMEIVVEYDTNYAPRMELHIKPLKSCISLDFVDNTINLVFRDPKLYFEPRKSLSAIINIEAKALYPEIKYLVGRSLLNFVTGKNRMYDHSVTVKHVSGHEELPLNKCISKSGFYDYNDLAEIPDISVVSVDDTGTMKIKYNGKYIKIPPGIIWRSPKVVKVYPKEIGIPERNEKGEVEWTKRQKWNVKLDGVFYSSKIRVFNFGWMPYKIKELQE